jgi:hypothetical protein
MHTGRHHLWKVDGVELMEPFILEAFNKLPEKSRCVLFKRMLTIVYLAQDGERPRPYSFDGSLRAAKVIADNIRSRLLLRYS